MTSSIAFLISLTALWVVVFYLERRVYSLKNRITELSLDIIQLKYEYSISNKHNLFDTSTNAKYINKSYL